MPVTVEDPADPRLDLYRGLTDADLRRRVEAEGGVFIAEGLRTVTTLLESPWPVVSVLMLPARASGAPEVVRLAERSGAEVFIAGADVMDTVAGFDVHRGVLAVARRVPLRSPGTLLRDSATVVIAEGVNDHENLGAIFRNAAALGADAVLLDPSSCDPLYRRSVRVSLGAVLRVPFSRLEPWPSALGQLSEHRISLVALDPSSTATLPQLPSLQRVALMVGSEADGLSGGALAFAEHAVRIPMVAGCDSLNVATALAIGLNTITAHVPGGHSRRVV